MEKIYFDHLRWNNPWNILLVFAFILAILSIGGHYYWSFKARYLNIFLLAIHSLLVLYFSRLYWYKNTIQWNQKTCVIQIKPYRFIGKAIPFARIKAVEKKGAILYLTLTKSKMIAFDLNHIRAVDQERLFHLLIE